MDMNFVVTNKVNQSRATINARQPTANAVHHPRGAV